MNDFFSNLMLASLISIIVSLLLIIHAFFRKKRYHPRLIFAGVSLGIFLFAAIGYTTTLSPEQRAVIEQKRIAKQAQEAQEKTEQEAKKAQEAAEREAKKAQEQAEKEAKKTQTAADKKQQDEQKAAEKKQKAEQDAKAKEQAAADAAAQKVYDDQAKYEAWIPEQIKLLCRQSLKENFISVDINDNLGKMDDSKIVLVHCQANMNVFSDEQLRRALMIQSSKVMETLYKANLPISEVTIFANGSLIDQYGNKFNDTIMKCTLSSDTAKKINWKHVHDLVMSFQDMQDELWYHPAIRK